jgi:lambda family phage portal protein
VNLFDAAAQVVRTSSVRRGGTGVVGFRGAEHTRLTRSWSGLNVSPNYELQLDLRTLRARSRQLARDHAWVSGLLYNLRANVLGPKGITLQVRLREQGRWWDPTAPFDKDANAQLEALWRWWGEEPEHVSTDGRTAWPEQVWFAEQTKFIDGEHLAFRDYAAANAFGYAIRTLDADYLDESYNVAPRAGQNEIRMGVELEPSQRVAAYHLWDRHPNDLMGGVRIRQRIPAEFIHHYFEPHRPGAVRGIPALSSALLSLRMLDKYKEAELVASVVSSAKMGWIKSNDTFIEGNENVELDDEGQPKTPDRIEMDAEPGLVSQLPPGWEFQAWDPQHPTSAFEAFNRAILREMGMSVGMSYATSSGDLSDVNYSSIRAGLHTERDIFRLRASFLARRYCRPIFFDVMSQAALKGLLPIADSRFEELRRSIEFQSRGWRWVDPLNDIQALQLAIGLGVGSRSAACAELGIDFEENLTLLKHEAQMAADAGVSITGEDSTGSALRPAPRHDGKSEKDDEEDETDTQKRGGRKALRAV